MNLTELEPSWIDHVRRDKIGVTFKCPCGCGHGLVVMFENPIDGKPPEFDHMQTFRREGTTFEDLTLATPIDRRDSCGWRGFIEDGKVMKARQP